MTKLHCDVTNCANNQNDFCCRPDIMVGGPQASVSNQTYCANFLDAASNAPRDAVDHSAPNTALDVHCEVEKCSYNQNRACNARHIDIRTTEVNNGQVKTECATFQTRGEGEQGHSSGGRNWN